MIQMQAQGYDLTISGDTVLATVQTGGTNPTITASGASLANQQLKLTDLPEEELIIFLGDGGARRLNGSI